MSDELMNWSDSPDEPNPLDPGLADQLGLGAGGMAGLPLPGLGAPTSPDPQPGEQWGEGQGGEGDEGGGAALPGVDWTVATPVDPSMAEYGSPSQNPDDYSDRVPGPTVPTTIGGGATGGGGVAGGAGVGITLRYGSELAGPLPNIPKTGCPEGLNGDYVTIIPKYRAMDVSVYNGWIRVAFWESVQPNTPVTYTGCYTHVDPTEPENIGRYSVHGRIDGIAFSDL